MKHTILCTGPDMASIAYDKLDTLGISYVKIPADTPADKIAAAVSASNCTALIVRTGKITDSVISAAPELRLIVKHGIGVDNIDLESATRKNIPVLIVPDAIAEAVAELVVGLIYCCFRKVVRFDRRMHEGVWDKSFSGASPRGKVLGLIGYGRIARLVVELLRPLKMQFIAYDAYLPSESWPSDVKRMSSVSDLVSTADVVSIHCPKTPETIGLIGKAEFELMKKSAFIINTARGGIVDEAALFDAVKNHQISGAALDTFDSEPLSPDNPLTKLPEVILTPHIASSTAEALASTGLKAVEFANEYLTNNRIDREKVINPSAIMSII